MPKINASFIRRVEPPAKGYALHWDDALNGFGIRLMASGVISYVFQYRVGGRSRRMTIHAQTPDDARTQAEVLKGQVSTGRLLVATGQGKAIDPAADRRKAERAMSGQDRFKAIAERWRKEDANKTRSGQLRFNQVERLAFPILGKLPMAEIRRDNINDMIARVTAENGPGMALYLFKAVHRILLWYEGQDEDFHCPIHREMRKSMGKIQRRQRNLSDPELRVVWRIAEQDNGPYGYFLRFVMLTAARRDEAGQMPWSELVAGSHWKIPPTRYKTGIEHVVPLSTAAKGILDQVPAFRGCDFVFTTKGKTPMNSFSDMKKAFDRRVLAARRKGNRKAEPLENWTVHDLRRTARTLMGRAGVATDIAERCLGHVKDGERATYDCYAYFKEKLEAFEKLAALVESIVR